MEAEVYAYGPDSVVKLYPGTTTYADLQILQGFYDSLDRQQLPYAVPRILTLAQEDGFLIAIEKRLSGTRMSDVLPALSNDQLDAMMQRYLTAALAVSQIRASSTLERYKLFDPDGLSQHTFGNWHQFLNRYLTYKLAQVTPYLSRDVPEFSEKVQHLRMLLDRPYRGEDLLIHGDFFPGNLLIDDQYEISALLDFGMLTMYGDYLFDMATGWVFFDMYDELKSQVRERYLELLLERLGEQVRGRLYRYVLLYSIFSANTYSRICGDGHYRWCAANLRNKQYWQAIE